MDRGSVQSALLTGMFGIQPEPTIGEVLVWVLYAVPMTIYVLRPAKPRVEGAPRAPSSASLEPAA